MRRFFLSIIILLSNTVFLSAQSTDIRWLREINSSGNSRFDRPMQALSNSEYVVGFGTPLLFSSIALINRDSVLWRKSLVVAASAFINSGATFTLKRIFNRPRPSVTYPDIYAYEADTRYSFPSGHTSNAFMTATAMSLAFKKWYVTAPCFVWAGAVGYSRMHLGMHYPSDVVGGALLGMGSAWLCYQGNKWWQKRQAAKR